MTYADLGGRGIKLAYSEAIGHDCPSCPAKMGEYCINPITGLEKPCPCAKRVPSRTGGSGDTAEKS